MRVATGTGKFCVILYKRIHCVHVINLHISYTFYSVHLFKFPNVSVSRDLVEFGFCFNFYSTTIMDVVKDTLWDLQESYNKALSFSGTGQKPLTSTHIRFVNFAKTVIIVSCVRL